MEPGKLHKVATKLVQLGVSFAGCNPLQIRRFSLSLIAVSLFVPVDVTCCVQVASWLDESGEATMAACSRSPRTGISRVTIPTTKPLISSIPIAPEQLAPDIHLLARHSHLVENSSQISGVFN